MIRILWAAFAASAVLVTYLCVTAAHREAPRRSPNHPLSRVTETASLQRSEEQERTGDAAPELSPQPAGSPAPAEVRAPEEGEAEGELPEPGAFLEQLMDLARKGDLEELSKYLSPGMTRLTQGLLIMVMMKKAGQKSEELEKAFDGLSFEFEELGDDLLRVHVEGAQGKQPEEIYLIPHENSWQLVTESDLPGPAADFIGAMNRLQLLALCQHTYFADGLGETGAAYAETLGELAEALSRSPLYADVLDLDFVSAAEAGYAHNGYTYGRIESGGTGFAYYAAPERYGPEMRETLLIDGAGRVWAKDLGGEPPPAAWPTPAPDKQGWKRRRSPWQ